MKKLLSAAILFLSCSSLKADITTFQIIYGDTTHNEARAIIQTIDNHYAFIGSSTVPGDSTADLILTIIDSVGNPSSIRISTLRDDYGFDLKQTSDNGYIICGSTYGSPLDPDFRDIMLIKTDQFGSIQWANAFGGFGADQAFSVSMTPDQGYFLTGVTNSGDSGYTQGLVIKVNFSGTPLWCIANSVFNHSIFNDGCAASDSSTIAVGCTIDSSGSKDLFAVKYDSIGHVIWSKRYAAAGDQDGNAVIATSDGGCMIAGYTNDSTVNGTDMLVTKLDSAGSVQWTKTYNYLHEDVANDIIRMRNGNFAITGFSNTDSVLSKKVADFLELDDTGAVVHSEMYGDSSANNMGYSIAETQDTGFVIGGVTTGFSKPHGQAYIIKTDSLAKTILCENPLAITIGSVSLTDTTGSETDTILLNYSSFIFVLNPNQNLFQSPLTYSFSAYCFSLLTSEHQSVAAINLYPNPVQQTLTVDLNNSEHHFETLIISDVLGRTIAEKKIADDLSLIQLNTESLKPGIYQVELRGQKNVAARKFVKVN